MLRPLGHIAAWIVWHTMRVSVLDDLDRPRHPGRDGAWHSYTRSAMPIYEYRCERGHQFEVIQRMIDDPVESCSTCGAPVQRVFHPVAVHFKGSGFYNTDYGKNKKGSASADGSNSESGSESSSKSEAKKESSSKSESSSSSSKSSSSG